MFSYMLFFCLFVSGNKNQLCPSGNKRYVGLFFPAKDNASNVKAAVVTQLDYSYYSKNKPLSFFFFFLKVTKTDQHFPEPLHCICVLCYFFKTGYLGGSSFPLFCQQLS